MKGENRMKRLSLKTISFTCQAFCSARTIVLLHIWLFVTENLHNITNVVCKYREFVMY